MKTELDNILESIFSVRSSFSEHENKPIIELLTRCEQFIEKLYDEYTSAWDMLDEIRQSDLNKYQETLSQKLNDKINETLLLIRSNTIDA